MNPLGTIEIIYATIRYGRLHEFVIPADAVPNGAQVDFLLSKYGVKCFGVGCRYDGGMLPWTNPKTIAYTFWTKRHQAFYAEYILSRAGIPLACPYLRDSHVRLYNLVVMQGRQDEMPPTRSKYFSVRTFSLNGLRWVGGIFGLFDAKTHTPERRAKSWKSPKAPVQALRRRR